MYDADRYQQQLLDNRACTWACISSAALLVAVSALVLLSGHGAVSPFAGAGHTAPASPLWRAGIVQVCGAVSIVCLAILLVAPLFYEARTYAAARRGAAASRLRSRTRRPAYGIGAA